MQCKAEHKLKSRKRTGKQTQKQLQQVWDLPSFQSSGSLQCRASKPLGVHFHADGVQARCL